MILAALSFPFRGNNPVILASGVLFASLPPVIGDLLPALPYVGLVGAILQGLVAGLVLLWSHEVMTSAMKGDEELPSWPAIDDLSEMVSQALHVLAPFAISFLPAIAFFVWWQVSREGAAMTPGALLVGGAATLVGLLYLPMGLLVFSYYGEAAIFHVPLVVRSSWRAGRDYWAVVGLLAALALAFAPLSIWIGSWPRLLANPAGALAGILFLTVTMRAVGLLYRRHQADLAWAG